MDILFPFSKLRPVQDKLMDDTWKALQEGKHLIAHAPTGLGKTAGVLSPALTYALQNGLTVFFLTPKHTQHEIAVETLAKIKERNGANFLAVDFIGKQWMCPAVPKEVMNSGDFSEYCRDMKKEEKCDYYNNVLSKKLNTVKEGAQLTMHQIKVKSPMHVQDVIKFCSDAEMCSYELCSLLAKEAQVIIADYYHIFHPRVRDAFLKRIGKQLKDSIIIVDEGHNLPSRIRDVMTSRINTFMLDRASKEAKTFELYDLADSLNYLHDVLVDLSKEILEENSKETYLSKEEFVKTVEESLGKDYDTLIGELESAAVKIRSKSKKSFCGGVAHFLEMWLGSDIGYTRILTKSKTRRGYTSVSLNYHCLSPALSSEKVIKESKGTIMMSGTLVPGEMYRDVLGFESNRTEIKEYPGSFPVQNRLALISPTVTTKYTQRNEEQYMKIAVECAKITKAVPHNIAIFFPSYFMLDKIKDNFETMCDKMIFIEKQNFDKSQRAELLESFKQNANMGAVLLGVQGGSFGEGIDLPGNFLQAVVVVGVPLAKPDLQSRALIDFYDYKMGKGWDYGYIFPAMNRAVQAAGRCIRSDTDRGCIVFLDERFLWKNYRRSIPVDWKVKVSSHAGDRVGEFFKKME